MKNVQALELVQDIARERMQRETLTMSRVLSLLACVFIIITFITLWFRK